MRCKKCGTENGLKSNFCIHCGSEFTQSERDAAYSKTVFGFLDKLEDIKSWLDLSKITDNRFVRIGVLAILLVLVAVNICRNGSHLAIRDGEGYTVAYAQDSGEYYVLTDLSEVTIRAYLPQKTESMTLRTFVEGVQTDCIEVDPMDGISLVRMSNGNYTMEANYEDGTTECLLFFVCEEDAAR